MGLRKDGVHGHPRLWSQFQNGSSGHSLFDEWLKPSATNRRAVLAGEIFDYHLAVVDARLQVIAGNIAIRDNDVVINCPTDVNDLVLDANVDRPQSLMVGRCTANGSGHRHSHRRELGHWC